MGEQAEPLARFVALCYCCNCPLTWEQYRQSEQCLYELASIIGVADVVAEEWVAVNMPACISCIENRQIWLKNIPPPLPLPGAQILGHDVHEPRRKHGPWPIARWLLYGSPLASALLMVSVRQFVLTT